MIQSMNMSSTVANPSAPAAQGSRPEAHDVRELTAQANAALRLAQLSGPVADADRAVGHGTGPGHSVQTALEQVRRLLPPRPEAVLPSRPAVLAPRPEVAMRPGQSDRSLVRAAMRQLVMYERALGIPQPPISPRMPLAEQVDIIDARYDKVRAELDRAARGERELPPTIDAARVREVVDLAKQRLAGVGPEPNACHGNHSRRITHIGSTAS